MAKRRYPRRPELNSSIEPALYRSGDLTETSLREARRDTADRKPALSPAFSDGEISLECDSVVFTSFKLDRPLSVRIKVNGEFRDVAPDTTIAGLLQELQLDSRRVAVEVNRDLVPREDHAATVLSGGDTMEVVTLVGGG
ncbi:MAG: sulfur carrier protein ThiS [Pirellulales bacterium]|nr:sulfur carrier protein ThiS [Pirellulales bacterium]